jgi:hypothetical protein
MVQILYCVLLLNESLQYGHSSLRQHLLVSATLTIPNCKPQKLKSLINSSILPKKDVIEWATS